MEIKSSQFTKGIRGTDEILTDDRPQIAFIGRSNVGKSSLINTLTGIKGLAKVGKKPGKTTEINYFLTNHSFFIVDLPGYGYAQTSAKEKEKLKNLIIWYFTYSGAKPQKVALILDSKAGLTPFDEQMIMILKEQKHPFVVVVNKIDKLTQKELSGLVSNIRHASGTEVLTSSTKTGKGVAALRDHLFG